MYINKGFTLIELLIVVAIISMTMAIGLPSFQSIIASTRLTSAANAMVSALQLAKMEAIKQHKDVSVAPLENKTWQDGWVVFIDKNSDGFQDTDELTISAFDTLGSSLTVAENNKTKKYAKYNASGRVYPLSKTFSFCSKDKSDFRNVVISSTGRVRVETASNSTTTYATSGC